MHLYRNSLFFVLTCCLLAASCRSTKGFDSPYRAEILETELYAVNDRASLAAALEERTEPIDELWVKFGTAVRQEGDRIAPGFTTLAMYRAPDSIMLGISRFEIGVVFTLLIENEVVNFYSNREKRLFTGTLAELAEKTALIGGLSPRDLVGSVTIQRELYYALSSGRPAAVIDRDTHLLVAARHPRTARQYLWLVRKTDGLVEEVLIRSATGKDETRIRYSSYDLISNEKTGTLNPYPAKLVLSVPSEGITIDADVKEYRLGRDLPPFVLPRAKETYPLRSLNFDSPP